MSKKDKLTIKQKKFVSTLVKTGNASEAARVAYKTKNPSEMGYRLNKMPKIQTAIHEALVAASLDEGYASSALKEIIAAGLVNKEEARPTDTLKGLELFFKLKGYLGNNGNMEDEENKAKEMTSAELVKELEEMNKKQDKIIKLYRIGAEEAEVIDEDTQGIDNQVQPEHQQVDKPSRQ